MLENVPDFKAAISRMVRCFLEVRVILTVFSTKSASSQYCTSIVTTEGRLTSTRAILLHKPDPVAHRTSFFSTRLGIELLDALVRAVFCGERWAPAEAVG